MNTEKSRELFCRAETLMPGGVNSPVRAFRRVGHHPIAIQSASGAYLTDVDGNEYVDFCLSFGPHLFGHCPPFVVEAVVRQAKLGMSYGANHRAEVELAEKILSAYPFLQKVRLVSSGTEAVMTAARLARGFTGRQKILQFEGCYHGHSDGFLARAGSGLAELSASSSEGVPSEVVAGTIVCRMDDLQSIERCFQEHGAQIAAVVLEAVPANHGLWLPTRERIFRIVELARQSGSLVILDEVITGFRVGWSGASGYFDLTPDLVTLGKILGGGLPIAAIAGRGEVLDCLAPVGGVYQAGTLSGNPIATAAGLAMLTHIESRSPYSELEKRTQEFSAQLSALLSRHGGNVVHASSMFWIRFSEDSSPEQFPMALSDRAVTAYARFFRECLERGVYLSPSPYEVGFLSTAHSDAVLDSVLEKVRGVQSVDR